MSSSEAISKAIAAVDDGAAIGLLQEMIGLQPQGEPAVQQLVADRLTAAGATVTKLTYHPPSVPLIKEFAATPTAASEDRDSIVGRFSGTGGRSVILFAHPDSEPLQSEPGWTHDPFSGVVENGRIYGWGVADDLAGVATAVAAMEAIKIAGIELAGDVIVASTPSKRHARGVHAVMHAGYLADAAIYLHPAESGVGMQEIKALASGQLEFTVTVRGKRPETTEPGHTSFAHTAINPLDKALKLIGALKDLDAARGERIHHPLIHAAIGRSTNLMISQLQFGTGGARSRLPEDLTFGGVISMPPGESIESVQAEVTAALAAVIENDDWLGSNPPDLTWLSGVTGAEVSPEHDLYLSVAEAIRHVCGVTPHVNPLHTSSDIRNPMVQKGIPTVGLGPLCGDLTQTGRRDEWVDRDDYLRAVKVAIASIIAWCGVR